MLYTTKYALDGTDWLIRGATTSTYVRRISVEQSAIDRRLLELEGVDSIQAGLRNTKIAGVDDMNVDLPLELPVSRTLLAKQKALLQFVSLFFMIPSPH